MLKKTYIRSLKKQMHAYAEDRREVIKISGDALHLAKRAIFSLHRGDKNEAKLKIKAAEVLFKKLQRTFKQKPALLQEGSYRAGLEEYVEAVLLYQFVATGSIGTVSGLTVDGEVYLAGLCDVPGELYRYAIKAATAKDEKTVRHCAALAEEIIGELTEFDLTKYLRTKFDQAKQAGRKIELVVYELSLRNHA